MSSERTQRKYGGLHAVPFHSKEKGGTTKEGTVKQEVNATAKGGLKKDQ